MDQFKIEWVDNEREPRCEPNPAYPEGIDLDVSRGHEPSCIATLPYPAKRIGIYLVECRFCNYRVACTTAGRVDDPRSVKMACAKKMAHA